MNRFNEVNRIIFDLDNTLFKHNKDMEHTAIGELLNIPVDDTLKYQLSYFFRDNVFRLKNKKIGKDYFARIAEDMIPVLRQRGITGAQLINILEKVETVGLMPGSIELLEHLKNKGYMIVSLTNWFCGHQVLHLKRLGIFDYFERIYSWDDFYAKPDSRAMIRALDHSERNENLLIGDDIVGDVAFAKKNGVKAIWFNRENEQQNVKIKPDLEVSSLQQIIPYL